MKKKILVVDANQIWRGNLRMILFGKGFEPIFAGNGMSAISMLNHNKVDIVITAKNMPLLDGVTLAKEIHKTAPALNVIGMSENSDDEGFFDEFWNKNSSADELIRLINDLIDKSSI